MKCTSRTFVRYSADGVRYVLRPVYAPPRPGKPSRPVTLREVYDRRRAQRVAWGGVAPKVNCYVVDPPRGRRVGGPLGALGEAVIRRLI